MDNLEDNRLYFNLWSGTHYLSKNDNIYHIERDCGLFSNLTILIYGILKSTLNGYKPDGIKLKLLEYDLERDFYHDIFEDNPEYNFTLDDIDKDEMDFLMTYCLPNMLGIGGFKRHHNFKILNKVLNKFYKINNVVKNYVEEIETRHQINHDKTVFIWARKTDKVKEIQTPDVDEYIRLFESLKLDGYDVIVQTDDVQVYSEFISKGFKFKNLDEIPFAKNDEYGFHGKLAYKTDSEFLEMYSLSKVEYLQKLYALTIVASKSAVAILYPGCLCTYIPVIRGSWYNVYSYKDKFNLIEY